MDGSIQIGGLNDFDAQGNVAIDDLNSETVNLFFVGIDHSGSMNQYTNDMIAALKSYKDALKATKAADEILISRANFHGSKSDITISGYKRIDDFDCSYNAGGGTPLYDVIVMGTQRLLDYRKQLKDSGMNGVKAVFGIFSDGEDMGSYARLSEAKACVDKLAQEEITTAFIAFGPSAEAAARQLGFKNILQAGASAHDLRHAWDQFSKSCSVSSKSVQPDPDNFFVIP